MFFWNSLVFWWSSRCWQFDLSFLCLFKLAWTFGSSCLTYCWTRQRKSLGFEMNSRVNRGVLLRGGRMKKKCVQRDTKVDLFSHQCCTVLNIELLNMFGICGTSFPNFTFLFYRLSLAFNNFLFFFVTRISLSSLEKNHVGIFTGITVNM